MALTRSCLRRRAWTIPSRLAAALAVATALAACAHPDPGRRAGPPERLASLSVDGACEGRCDERDNRPAPSPEKREAGSRGAGDPTHVADLVRAHENAYGGISAP